jgi:hypothetical protein
LNPALQNSFACHPNRRPRWCALKTFSRLSEEGHISISGTSSKLMRQQNIFAGW